MQYTAFILLEVVMMRIDRFLSESGLFSRKEASEAVRRGRVTVNGSIVRDPSAKIDEKTAVVSQGGSGERQEHGAG